MPLDIWQQCKGENQVGLLEETAWRLVESQQITATRKLVDSLAEQAILEALIESVKPSLPLATAAFHPLLCTPFRYPPLKHGSRFGTPFEPSLWYGSLTLEGAMAEKAYYQYNFMRASEGDFGLVEVPLTAFSIPVSTKQGVKLNLPPFAKHTDLISSPISYQASQLLGQHMRQQHVEAFSYQSARDKQGSINVGVFTPKAFKQKNPMSSSFQSWRCLSTKENIDFMQVSIIHRTTYTFPLDHFLVEGVLPFPAV